MSGVATIAACIANITILGAAMMLTATTIIAENHAPGITADARRL